MQHARQLRIEPIAKLGELIGFDRAPAGKVLPIGMCPQGMVVARDTCVRPPVSGSYLCQFGDTAGCSKISYATLKRSPTRAVSRSLICGSFSASFGQTVAAVLDYEGHLFCIQKAVVRRRNHGRHCDAASFIAVATTGLYRLAARRELGRLRSCVCRRAFWVLAPAPFPHGRPCTPHVGRAAPARLTPIMPCIWWSATMA